jgi:hypothetical protein
MSLTNRLAFANYAGHVPLIPTRLIVSSIKTQ